MRTNRSQSVYWGLSVLIKRIQNHKPPSQASFAETILIPESGPVLQRLVAQRGMIGWLALVGLLGGGLLCLLNETQKDGAGGSLLRVGIVLGSLWLALPDRNRPGQYRPGAKSFPWWQGLSVLLVMMAVVHRPVVVIFVLLILGALSLFARPRT